jgi:hypothetical protein
MGQLSLNRFADLRQNLAIQRLPNLHHARELHTANS